ncbi:MAG: hypothetical protein NT091_02465, partial [Candidatus Falkowbacteria bacterium]|nr:hypothetical protein [Candidatus Falkowbacteria bacterium]
INYTPQSLHMYKKTYERQRETIIYVTDKVLSEDKLDGDVVKSNNKNFIKKEVTDFYNQYKSDENYNQNKFLLPYLDSLKASYQKGTDYRIITDGTFNGVEANSYNFDEKRFIQHSQEIIARYKQIENARIEEAKYEKYKVVENARTEQPKYAKTIEVPSPLSQFDAYFSSKLKNKLNGLDGLCFELIQNETNKNVSWLSEKNKLFAPYICQQNESK